MRLFARVEDHDPCLKVVMETLSTHLLSSAALAGSINSDNGLKLRHCERMECFRMLMIEFEDARAKAKAWTKEQSDIELHRRRQFPKEA